MLADERVATVVRPLDLTLKLFKYALVPAVAISLTLPALRSLTTSSGTGLGDVLLNLIGPALAAVYLLLLQVDAVNSRIDRAIARLRRRVAIACNHDYAAEHGNGGVACRLTPGVFQAPTFNYKGQQKVVTELSSACALDQRGQYWFVEGRSGTGKTRTALRLVHRLVRDPDLFELGSRCYLYDFGYSGAIQEDLSRLFTSPRHENAVILVDNFQLVGPSLLRQLTRMLVDEPDETHQRLVVFLSREAGAWNLSPGRDVRLLSEAKSADRHRTLEGPPASFLSREISTFSPEAAKLIRRLRQPGRASATQLHLAQVIARNRSLPPEVTDIIQLLAGEPESASPENVQMLALLTALSMHKGTFSRRSLRRAMRVAARDGGARFTFVETMKMRRTFRRFRECGLVPKITLDSARFIFHEDIARECIDRLFDVPLFSAPFLAVGEARLRRQTSEGDAFRAWLIAVEIGDQEALEANFDGALLYGAFQRMLQCLRRAADRYEFTGSTLLQLAILLDRTGEFVESRDLFASGLDEQLDLTSELLVILAVSRIEARHQWDCEEDIETLLTHRDRFAKIVGEYWQVHIAAHYGTFEPDRLLSLATEGSELLKGEKVNSHWRLYSLSRMYFDSLRNLYLAGENDATAYATPEHQALDEYLSTRLPIYSAMNILYTQAHLVGHVFLPRLAIFGEPVSADDAAIARIDLTEAETVNGLIAATQRLYRRASEEFWLYGDREEFYLQAENLNAKMIEPGVDLRELDDPLDRYEEFIVSGARDMLGSYPHFYRLRREVLWYFRVVLDPATQDYEEADQHLAEAEIYLQRVFELDRNIGNSYGLLRAELLETLLRAIGSKSPLHTQYLAELEQRSAAHGYGFEEKLLRFLIDKRGELGPGELEAIFRFYPFVNQ
jgi:hypothetical protein